MIEIRPLSLDDVAAVTSAYEAAEAVDDVGEHVDEDDVRNELTHPELVLEHDAFGAFAGDELVGYVTVLARGAGDDRKVEAFGVTVPEHRGEGVGTLLAGRMLARAGEQAAAHGGPLPMLLEGRSDNYAQSKLLASFGFEEDRYDFGMELDLAGLGPAAPLAEGYVIRGYQDADALALLAAHNTAFVDHPNSTPWTEQEWRHVVLEDTSFVPELTFVVTTVDAPDTIVAYLQTAEYAAKRAITGVRDAYVSLVGTLREHRGRGLAGAVLGHALAAYRDAGYEVASIHVDSHNPTGALGVYERAGFKVNRTLTTYRRLVG